VTVYVYNILGQGFCLESRDRENDCCGGVNIVSCIVYGNRRVAMVVNMNESGSTGTLGTFVIRILNRQNATWQGVVTRVDKKEERPFRSLLELIRLIDSAFEDEDKNTRPRDA
jgi:hypothetical protein